MPTRADYLERRVTHREYYAQFVTEGMRNIVARQFGERLTRSTDPHLNDIPLAQWDALVYHACAGVDKRMRELGDYLTPAGGVSLLKEAARQVIEGNAECSH